MKKMETTPQDLIHRLLKAMPYQCAVCKSLATRSAQFKSISPGNIDLCDEHSVIDLPILGKMVPTVEYKDHLEASLIREAQKWLDENKIEER